MQSRPFPARISGLALTLLALLVCPPLPAQDQEPAPPEAAPGTADDVQTLRALAASHASLRSQISARQADLAAAAGTPEEAAIKEEIAGLEERRRNVESDLMAIAAGVTLEEYLDEAQPEEDLTLQQEFSRLLAPMLSEVRKLSQKPRALQDLKDNLAKQQQRVELAELAIASLKLRRELLQEAAEPANSSLFGLLEEMRQQWQTRLDESRSHVLVIERQLGELRKNQTSVWDMVSSSAKHFVFSRGRYLLLAAAAFVVVFFGIRLLYLYGLKVIPAAGREKLSFFRRLLALLNQGLSFVFATLAALGVLYASGDWLLGGIAVLALIAILLAAKSGFTRYFDQMRMLLNLGAAREGERVLINGVPWLIGMINLQTRLTNPCLDGPGLRLSLEALMDMTSRPCAPNETWFPCRSGDTVLLENDILARVERTGPDLVEIRYRGGITKHIPTSTFVTMQPANLSGGFLVSTVLGLDYSLQAQITDSIPAKLQDDVTARLLRALPKELLVDVRVEFQQAGSSSLDLWIGARFTGEAAERFLELRRQLQQYAVESCTVNGWPISFPQLVLHRTSAN